jgi:hypothetical protein
MKEIDWDKVNSGTKFKALLRYRLVEGVIEKQYNQIFLCQNVFNGSEPANKHGFKYGWSINRGQQQDLVDNYVDPDNFKIESDKDFNSFTIKKLHIDDGWLKKEHESLVEVNTNTFHNCQNLTIGGYCGVAGKASNILNEIFTFLSNLKPFSVIDINKCYKQYLPKDEDCYVFKRDYISTNGSQMCIIGLKNRETASYYKKLNG